MYSQKLAYVFGWILLAGTVWTIHEMYRNHKLLVVPLDNESMAVSTSLARGVTIRSMASKDIVYVHRPTTAFFTPTNLSYEHVCTCFFGCKHYIKPRVGNTPWTEDGSGYKYSYDFTYTMSDLLPPSSWAEVVLGSGSETDPFHLRVSVDTHASMASSVTRAPLSTLPHWTHFFASCTCAHTCGDDELVTATVTYRDFDYMLRKYT